MPFHKWGEGMLNSLSYSPSVRLVSLNTVFPEASLTLSVTLAAPFTKACTRARTMLALASSWVTCMRYNPYCDGLKCTPRGWNIHAGLCSPPFLLKSELRGMSSRSWVLSHTTSTVLLPLPASPLRLTQNAV